MNIKDSVNKPDSASQAAPTLGAVTAPWQQEPASLFQQLSSTENGLSAGNRSFQPVLASPKDI